MEETYEKAFIVNFPYGSYAVMHDREQGEPFTDSPHVRPDGDNVDISRKGMRVTIREPKIYVPKDIFESSGICAHLEKRAVALADEFLAPVDDLLEGKLTELAKEGKIHAQVRIHQYHGSTYRGDFYGVNALIDCRDVDETVKNVNPFRVLNLFENIPEGFVDEKRSWVVPLARYMIPANEHCDRGEFRAQSMREALENAIEFYERTPELREWGKMGHVFE